MSVEFKVVSGSTNVLLLINGKGIPAQVVQPKERDSNELYRFLIRDDRLRELLPERTCRIKQHRCTNCDHEINNRAYFEKVALDDEYWTAESRTANFCPSCGAKVVSE